jgi:hypothetical protein
MTKRKYEKPLHLDMPFDEALRRFAQTDPREIPENKKLRKAGRKKRPARKFTAADRADE